MLDKKTKAKEQNNASFGESKISQDSNEISYKRLVLMWGLILLGYFLFVVQWYSIGNFSDGYSENIGKIANNPALNAMPNWTITLMRGIGSILAGWLLAKIGHRYAVITVLSLMVASFPFIIFAGIKGEVIGSKNSDGIYPINFSMFLFFRLFLAVGGTTMITYTNSVISKMPTIERAKYMRINQFGFNGGALFANIFFCFGISKVINGSPAVWISILSIFIALIFILLIMYIFFGKEVVPPQKKLETNSESTNMITFGKVIKESYTWKLSILFAAWLVAVVFINSSTMRSVIEQSPANFQTLINWNKANGMQATSLAQTTLSTANSVVVGSGYEWVWPTYTSLFVSGFFIGLFIIAPFNKTIYKRKFFMHLMFIIGISFELISILCGYLGGYENKAALAFFLIFIFLSGIFLWSVQPVMLSLYQQAPQSSPKYTGIISGLIWGIGYVGYTLSEIWLSVSLSYIDNVKYFTKENIKLLLEISSQQGLVKTKETVGSIIVLVGFFLIICSVFIPIQLLPEAGIKDENGVFKEFERKWKPWEWNFKKDEILIK